VRAWRRLQRELREMRTATPHPQQLGHVQLLDRPALDADLVSSVTRVSCSGGEGGPMSVVDFLGLDSASATPQSLALRPLATHRTKARTTGGDRTGGGAATGGVGVVRWWAMRRGRTPRKQRGGGALAPPPPPKKKTQSPLPTRSGTSAFAHSPQASQILREIAPE
jgi:hypothetical protein